MDNTHASIVLAQAIAALDDMTAGQRRQMRRRLEEVSAGRRQCADDDQQLARWHAPGAERVIARARTGAKPRFELLDEQGQPLVIWTGPLAGQLVTLGNPAALQGMARDELEALSQRAAHEHSDHHQRTLTH